MQAAQCFLFHFLLACTLSIEFLYLSCLSTRRPSFMYDFNMSRIVL
uniref:Uncharacterized protein n=1 Tax=Arundo donax TaxID=35708 RepID=A0A0A8ZDM4_ARUDO